MTKEKTSESLSKKCWKKTFPQRQQTVYLKHVLGALLHLEKTKSIQPMTIPSGTPGWKPWIFIFSWSKLPSTWRLRPGFSKARIMIRGFASIALQQAEITFATITRYFLWLRHQGKQKTFSHCCSLTVLRAWKSSLWTMTGSKRWKVVFRISCTSLKAPIT